MKRGVKQKPQQKPQQYSQQNSQQNLQQKFQQKLQKSAETFLRGRNGMDPLSRFLLYCSLFLLLVSVILFSVSRNSATAAKIVQFAAVAVLTLSYIRALSRNIENRSKENVRFLKTVHPMVNWFQRKRRRFDMRRNYKLFCCPGCKTTLRVPKGKGRLNLTCPKCHTKFKGKS